VARQDLSDQSLGELVQRMSQQTSRLVRDEIRLAEVELQEKGKRAGVGAGLFGTAGLIAAYALAALIAGAILLLAKAVDSWVAALIVAGALAAVAGIVALVGRRQIKQATPAKPEQAITSAQRDIETIKHRARRQ
jgi:uncharacterized membrane protein YqjE